MQISNATKNTRAAAFLLGVSSQVCQLLLLRELLMVFHGNELSVGIILASWMGWVGLGSILGSFISRKTDRPLLWLFICSSLNVLFVIASIAATRLLPYYYQLVPGSYLPLTEIALSTIILTLPVGVVFGLMFILITRLIRNSAKSDNTSGGSDAYALEAAGNIAGGFVFSLILVNIFEPVLICILATGLLIAGLYKYSGRDLLNSSESFVSFTRILVHISLVIVVLTIYFSSDIENFLTVKLWKQLAPGHELVENVQSKYGTLTLLKKRDQFSFFQSGKLLFNAMKELVEGSFEQNEPVVFANMAMVQHRSAERVLLVGGGLRGIVGEILSYNVKHLDYVELDEVLVKTFLNNACDNTRSIYSDERLNLIHGDGRVYVRNAENSYDLIIIDMPDPLTLVNNRYYTQEFFREASRALREDGVLVFSALSTSNMRSSSIANRNAAIYHTLDSVFSHVKVAGEREVMFFASDCSRQLVFDSQSAQRRFFELAADTENFNPHQFNMLLHPTRTNRLTWVLANHGRKVDSHIKSPPVPDAFPPSVVDTRQSISKLPPVQTRYFINSDFRPLIYYYSLLFWNEQTRSSSGGYLSKLLHFNPVWLMAVIFLPLIIALLLDTLSRVFKARRKSILRFYRRKTLYWAAFTTGLSTMTLQIALLFCFQNIFGFIYEMTGAITALFMTGLFFGTKTSRKYFKEQANIAGIMTIQLLLAVFAFFCGIFLPFASTIGSGLMFVFGILTFVAGFLNGLDFPLVTACIDLINKRPEKSVAGSYSIELMGACVGSVVAGAVFIPVAGVVACCFFAAVANLSAFGVLFLSRKVVI